jgi:O-antigen/teichoic acid export membrane protein
MSALRSVWKLGTANLTLLAIQTITTLALGATLRPEELGIFFLGLTFAQLFAPFATFRFDGAYPAASSVKELVPLVVLSVAGIVVTVLVQYAVFSVLRAYRLFEFEAMPSWIIWIAAPLTAALATAQLGRYWAIRHASLRAIERATYARAFSTALLRGAIILAAVSSSALPLGVALLVAELLIAALTAALLLPRFASALLLSSLRVSPLRSALSRNWKFPTIEAPSTILDSVALNAPIFLVTHFFGLSATANFGLAFRALAIPIGQLALALTDVLQTEYATFLRASRLDELKRLFYRSSRSMLLGGAAVCALVYFFLEDLVTFAVGSNLDAFAPICVIISPWIALNVAVNINSPVLQLLKRQELKLAYDAFSILAVPAVVLIQHASELALLEFIGLMTASQVLGYGIYLLVIRSAVVTAVRLHGEKSDRDLGDRDSTYESGTR